MTSFFASIRGYFKSEYHGRYLGIILKEVASHEPESFARLIDHVHAKDSYPLLKEVARGLRSGRFSVGTEYQFQSSSKRRADLVVMDGKKPLVFFEIKEFDHRNSSNDHQLDDYLSMLSADIGFIHIHRFLPTPNQIEKIRRAKNAGAPASLLSYDQIYRILNNSKDEDRALGALLCGYLEDIGVGIYRELKKDDWKAVSFLASQMLGLPIQSGLGRLKSKATVERGPDILKAMLANVEVVGEWIRRKNVDVLGNRFSTRIWLEPKFDHKILRRDISGTGDKIASLPKAIGRYVRGGEIYFEAKSGVISHKSKLQIYIGYALQCRIGKGVKSYPYVYFSNTSKIHEGNTLACGPYLKSIPNEQKALKLFQKTLKESCDDAIGLASPSEKSALKNLKTAI